MAISRDASLPRRGITVYKFIVVLLAVAFLPLRGEAAPTDQFNKQLASFRALMTSIAAKPGIISDADYSRLHDSWKVVIAEQAALSPLEQRRVEFRFRSNQETLFDLMMAKEYRQQGELDGARDRMQTARTKLGDPSARAIAFRPTPVAQPKRAARATVQDPLPVTGCEQFVVPFGRAVGDLQRGLELLEQARSMAGKAYVQFEMGRIPEPSGTVSAELRTEIEKLLANADAKLKACPAPAEDCENCRLLKAQLARAIRDARTAAASLFAAKSLDQIQQGDRPFKRVRQLARDVENRMPLD